MPLQAVTAQNSLKIIVKAWKGSEPSATCSRSVLDYFALDTKFTVRRTQSPQHNRHIPEPVVEVPSDLKWRTILPNHSHANQAPRLTCGTTSPPCPSISISTASLPRPYPTYHQDPSSASVSSSPYSARRPRDSVVRARNTQPGRRSRSTTGYPTHT